MYALIAVHRNDFSIQEPQVEVTVEAPKGHLRRQRFLEETAVPRNKDPIRSMLQLHRLSWLSGSAIDFSAVRPALSENT